MVAGEVVILIHGYGEGQRADFLTKTVPGVVFRRYVDYVMFTR